jgi:chaperonin GroEL
MKDNIIFGEEARREIQKGINKLADAVKVTMGAQGRYVTISNQFGVNQATKDGVTVAKAVAGSLSEPFENVGSRMVSEVCVKVADLAGDGTTTAAVLAQAIYNAGIKAINDGANPVLLSKGIKLAVDKVVQHLIDSAEDVTIDTIKDIATISANNDSEIGDLITEAVLKLGMNAVITPEKSKANKTYVDYSEGLEFESGYLSHYFVTNPDKMLVEHNSPAIFIYDGVINSVQQIMPMLQYVQNEKFPLVIIANDIHGEVLNLLALNKSKANFPIVAIRAPYYGDTRREFVEDIALTTGATIISSELQEFSAEVLGGCDKVIVKKDNTIIISGHGDKEEIKERISSLKNRIANNREIENEKFIRERISKLSGGIAVVYVGGNTELEMKERFDRVEDALLAVRSAVSEGVIDGGGIAYINAILPYNKLDDYHDDVLTGFDIIMKSISEPFRQIIKNAGLVPDDIYDKLEHSGQGYDVKSGKFVIMKDAGIIDPLKVARVALESAASISSILLTTECSVIN